MILRERHKIQYLLSTAMIFLVLGLGNVIYGRVKYKEYKRIYEKVILEIDENSPYDNLEIKGSDLPNISLMQNGNLTEKTRHLKRSHGRIIFYQFFVKGGKIFLGISLIFFLIAFALFINKKDKKEL
ncbi:MAG: hypothetical protein ACOX3T_07735 [Bdellovibrionota bacterium]